MEEVNGQRNRRTFRWPGAAWELVSAYLRSRASTEAPPEVRIELNALITRIASVSGNPRVACWRFVRQAGVRSNRTYRLWTKPEQQKLLDLIASHSLEEVVLLLRRSSTSIRSMLHRLGASARMGQDWFTKHTLAAALHVRPEQVQKWIDQGWLASRTVQTRGLTRHIIDAEDFCDFCKQHRREIVGYRLNLDKLNFVQTFVFPPSHAELLPVREAKREEASYQAQRRQTSGDAEEDELDAIA